MHIERSAGLYSLCFTCVWLSCRKLLSKQSLMFSGFDSWSVTYIMSKLYHWIQRTVIFHYNTSFVSKSRCLQKFCSQQFRGRALKAICFIIIFDWFKKFIEFWGFSNSWDLNNPLQLPLSWWYFQLTPTIY